MVKKKTKFKLTTGSALIVAAVVLIIIIAFGMPGQTAKFSAAQSNFLTSYLGSNAAKIGTPLVIAGGHSGYNLFSPNGDGDGDILTVGLVGWHCSDTNGITVDIYNPSGVVAMSKTFTKNDFDIIRYSPLTFFKSWGFSLNGQPEGRYVAHAYCVSKNGDDKSVNFYVSNNFYTAKTGISNGQKWGRTIKCSWNPLCSTSTDKQFYCKAGDYLVPNTKSDGSCSATCGTNQGHAGVCYSNA